MSNTCAVNAIIAGKPAQHRKSKRVAGLDLQNIRKSFGAIEVIRDLSLSIVEGEFVVLVGPSGCGKSTLLRCIAGLEPISSGKFVQDGKDITAADPVERGIAMVFQSYALYPHMSVAENIGFGLKIAGEPKVAIKARVLEISRLLKLEALLARKPRELSGGQRQRVAIGRALARKPKLFLFDEPLSNLDASLRAEMRVELAKLHASLGNTMIYVTHDQVEGMTLADRIVVMNGGVIEQHGAPLELFNHPANKFVASFLGQPQINFVKVTGAHRDGDNIKLKLPGGEAITVPVEAGEAIDLNGLEVGVRPEDVLLSEPGKGLPVKIDVVEHLGNETILYGHLADTQPMVIRLAGQAKFSAGEEVWHTLPVARTLVFDQAGRNVRRRAGE